MTNEPSLLEALLAEQQSLTAVDRFSHAHDGDEFLPHARRYRDLIPLDAPRLGEQYAFEVELDKCSGCKACVTACHSLNGLDENETWRDVGLLINGRKSRCGVGGMSSVSPHLDQSRARETRPSTVMQHVTTACHHCVDPACLNGCPVLAYEKDPITGIVRHLDDQCIGCQYCVLKCPYDVPKYNDRLGIVRKCDMCMNRLAVGEAPACVQACPNEAIRITKVQTSTVTIEFRERGKNFLNGAPAGDYTLPTTRYVSAASSRQSVGETCEVGRGVLTAPPHESASGPEVSSTTSRRAEDSLPYLIAADSQVLLPQPAHWPLVVMLVLSQASVGVAGIAALQRPAPRSLLLMSLTLAVVGLGASAFHLGRPLGAWRAFLNLRRSWMSREIVVFGMFSPLLVMAAALTFGAPVSDPAWFGKLVRAGSETGAPIVGLLGVFCSAMIYHDTRRPLWCWRRSMSLFLGTTIGLGAAAAAIVSRAPVLFTVVIVAASTKLFVEVLTLRHIATRTLSPLKKTALLVTGRFQHIAFARLLCAMVGGIGLPLLLLLNVFPSAQLTAALAFGLLLTGELLERFLFFTTVVAPKMPGGLPT